MPYFKHKLQYWLLSGALLGFGWIGSQTQAAVTATTENTAPTTVCSTTTEQSAPAETTTPVTAQTTTVQSKTIPATPVNNGTDTAEAVANPAKAESSGVADTNRPTSTVPSGSAAASTTTATTPTGEQAPVAAAANNPQVKQPTTATTTANTAATSTLAATLQQLRQIYPQLAPQLDRLLTQLTNDDTAALRSRLLPLTTTAQTQTTVTALVDELVPTKTPQPVTKKTTTAAKQVTSADLFANLKTKSTKTASSQVTAAKTSTKKDTPFKVVDDTASSTTADSAVTDTVLQPTKTTGKMVKTAQQVHKPTVRTVLNKLLPTTGEQINFALSALGLVLVGSAAVLYRRNLR